MNAPPYRPSAEERERALTEEAELLRRVAHNVPVAIAYYERAGFRCRYANQGYARMFGLDEQRILGRSFAEVIGAEAAAQIQPSVDTVLAERRTVAYERELPPDDGGPRFIEVSLVPHLGADGDAIGAFVLIADITRHRRAERALRESEDRLARFMHATQEGIVFHRDGFITDANPPLLALVGYTLEELRGRWAIDLVAPDQRARVADVMARGAELRYESALQHRDGRRIPVEFIVRTMQFGSERLRMTIVRDMREWLDAQARIRHLAEHDVLTGLPNRSAFIERLQQRLAATRPGAPATGDAAPVALLFVDLDHFKRVNDSLGHLAGDTLLRTVADRLRAALGAHDLAGRFGGDEFLVLLAADAGGPVRDRAAVERRARRLLEVVQAPVALPGASISVTPSIGIALFPDDGADADTLIQHADTAMYRAKGSGRAACAFFEPAMAAEVFSELQLESRLAEALAAGEFELLYQPQLRGADGAVVAVEALLRWRHPQRGLLAPADFLAVAEARRLLLPIGRWVLHEALHQAARWPAGTDGAPLRVAVNLSALEFQAVDLLPMVTAALADAGVDGRTLEIELTEPLLTGDPAPVQRALAALRALGVRLTLDDFGTGCTSFGHLRGLPIDRLKVDRSFVGALPDDAGAAAIVRAIAQLATAFGLRLVAEGIETEAQREWVLAHGCTELQGHALQTPLDAEAIARWLQARAVAAD
jgi:diguanylate cyclase (GGDEF)-like protein/PAS domain S-box-containing protein